MPLQATSGAASQDAFGGNGVAVVPTYIEDVFSTYLYEGNGTTQQIVNGIDLSTKGGLVWTKSRSNAFSNMLMDTVRTSRYLLNSNTTGAQADQGSTIANFNTDGYTFTSSGNSWNTNNYTNNLYVGWTFRKQPKFFDVVTFTKSSSSQVISHNLNSTAGCIFIKRTDSTGGWLVAHRGYTGGITAGYTLLNATSAFTSSANAVTAADSTSFTLGSDVANGDFVAYLFAHDAGGFGLTGTDNVISCGTFTTDAGGAASITLGYEPQWVMHKRTDSTGNWVMADIMRGATNGGGGAGAYLYANTSGSEVQTNGMIPNATGFTVNGNTTAVSATYIYIAIRRGPMKVPTTGTSVFAPIARTGTGAAATVTGAGFTPDWWYCVNRTAGGSQSVVDRLRGDTVRVRPNNTSAEDSLGTNATFSITMDGIQIDVTGISFNQSGETYINYLFKRAPSFMEICAYTGTGSARTISHNLAAVPELIIVKQRSATRNWNIYSQTIGASDFLIFGTDARATDSTRFNGVSPTSSVFSVGTSVGTNESAGTYVAYLFATCPGVSKVGSYTGTAATLQIDCGFTGGARFVLIKRTDSTGDWYCWDTARGIVSGNDPYLLWNSTAAEVTSTDYVDTYSAGFEISSTAPAAINASGGTYIFLAIA